MLQGLTGGSMASLWAAGPFHLKALSCPRTAGPWWPAPRPPGGLHVTPMPGVLRAARVQDQACCMHTGTHTLHTPVSASMSPPRQHQRSPEEYKRPRPCSRAHLSRDPTKGTAGPRTQGCWGLGICVREAVRPPGGNTISLGMWGSGGTCALQRPGPSRGWRPNGVC